MVRKPFNVVCARREQVELGKGIDRQLPQMALL